MTSGQIDPEVTGKIVPDEELHAGSPGEGEPEFLVVGKLHRPHGVHGEMLMEIVTDFPERLKPGVMVYVGEAFSPHTIRTRRSVHGGLLISLHGLDTPEAAGELRNTYIYVRADDRPPLPEGEYYHHQLIGLLVINEAGQELGRLSEVLSYPANDVFIVQPLAGREILIPVLKSVIMKVDLDAGRMQVNLPPGLLPD